MSRPYAVVAGSRRVAMSGARATGPCNAHTTLEVTLKLRRKAELPALDGRPAKAMTRAELAAQYGASDEDVDAVVKAFAAFGIKPVATSAATRSVRLSGTVKQMEQAFQVKLFNYSFAPGSNEVPYRGRVGDIHVPAEVKDSSPGCSGWTTAAWRVAAANTPPARRFPCTPWRRRKTPGTSHRNLLSTTTSPRATAQGRRWPSSSSRAATSRAT